MNFREYREMIKDLPYTDTLKYAQAYMWLHPDRLPLGLVSVRQDAPAIIKIPDMTTNGYGRKVPVVSVSKDAFAGHDELTDIILPSTLQSIPAGAFAGCSKLKRIVIPRKINIIREGTFSGCEKLEDVYFEGSMEEWKKINIIHDRHDIEFGELIPGTPVLEIKEERLIHIPGNDALLKADIHFNCEISYLNCDPKFELNIGGRDVTDFFRTM